MLTETLESTRLATLDWSVDGILCIRFRQGITIDPAGVEEIVSLRTRMSEGRRVPVLVVLPREMDTEMNVIITDNGLPVRDLTLAEATVGTGASELSMANLYYAHFQQPYPTAVFPTEQEAVEWLLEQARCSG